MVLPNAQTRLEICIPFDFCKESSTLEFRDKGSPVLCQKRQWPALSLFILWYLLGILSLWSSTSADSLFTCTTTWSGETSYFAYLECCTLSKYVMFSPFNNKPSCRSMSSDEVWWQTDRFHIPNISGRLLLNRDIVL